MGFVANFIRFPAVQKFWKSVKIWQSYRQLKGGYFSWDTMYMCYVYVSFQLLPCIRQHTLFCWYVDVSSSTSSSVNSAQNTFYARFFRQSPFAWIFSVKLLQQTYYILNKSSNISVCNFEKELSSSWDGRPLATIDMGQELGAVPLFWVGELGPIYSSNTVSSGLRPTSVPSGILIHAAVWP